MKFKSSLIALASMTMLLTITGCGKQASSHSHSSSSSSKVSKSSASNDSSSSDSDSDDSSSSSNDSNSSSSSSSATNSSSSSDTFPSTWTSSVPDAVSGTWKNDQIEFVFSKSAADSKNSDSDMWVGGSWKPKYKYVGNNTYEAVAGDQDGQGNTNYYKIHITGNDTAQVYVSMDSSFKNGGSTTVNRTSDKVTDHG